MKKKPVSFIAFILLLFTFFFATPTYALVTYEFEFSEMFLSNGSPLSDFSISITTDDYITSTGMQALGYTITDSYASLGYNVNYFGTNNDGLFGFDDDNSSVLDDGGFSYDGLSFIFDPLGVGSYITSPGIWNGSILGNAPTSFRGNGVLTVSSPVPEPSTMLLLGVGLVGLAGVKRRRLKK